MVKNNSLKYGFSLVEALVVMTVAAIFVAVMASVIPHKSSPKISAEAHGGFECYWQNDKLYSRSITAGKENEPKEVSGDHCVFKPSQYANYVIFNVVGGGSVGGSGTNAQGGGAGEYVSAFVHPQKSYNLFPGKGGTSSNRDGEPSYVKVGDKEIVSVNGGHESVNIEHTTFDDIIEVHWADKMPEDVPGLGCHNTPRAWLDYSDNKIHVFYCANNSQFAEDAFEYANDTCSTDSCKLKTIRTSPLKGTPLSKQKDGEKVWQYYDIGIFIDKGLRNKIGDNKDCTYQKITSMSDPMCPSRYKIEITLDVPDNGDEGAVSTLTKYAEFMQYTNLKDIKPGNGGAKNNGPGSPGAILVSW